VKRVRKVAGLISTLKIAELPKEEPLGNLGFFIVTDGGIGYRSINSQHCNRGIFFYS
jgi:hypothetical protein